MSLNQLLPCCSQWLVLSFFFVALTACGSGSNTLDRTEQEIAIEKIADYAEDGMVEPSLQDYLDAEIVGVDAANLTDVNTEIEKLTREDVDTMEEIQAVVNHLISVKLDVPSLIDIVDQNYLKGATITTLVFTNEGGGSLTSCSASSLPVGLSIVVSSDKSSCQITGTPTVTQALTEYTITATNATGSDAASVSIEVFESVTAVAEWQGVEIAPTGTDFTRDIQDPQLAMDGIGNAWLTWKQADEINSDIYSIWVNHYNFETGWGTAEIIETLEYNTETPVIAINSSGDVMVVWGYEIPTNDGGHVWQLWGSHFNSSQNSWNTPTLIVGGTSSNERSLRAPQVAMDENGKVLPIWHMRDNNNSNGNELMTSSFDPTTNTWGVATELATTPITSSDPKLAMNDSGQAVAIWRDNHTFLVDGLGVTRTVVMGQVFNPDNGWGETQQISFADDTTASLGSISPQLAIDASGDAIVVWSHNKALPLFEDETNIWARRYSVSNGWEDSTLLESNNFKYAISPQVAMNDSGKAVVVWVHKPEDQASAIKSIWANQYESSTGWSAAQEIKPSSVWQNTLPLPQVSLDADGNAMAVWLHRENSMNNVEAIRFDQPLGTWGALEIIGSENVPTDNPLMAFNGMGRVITVWMTREDFSPYELKSNYFK